MAKCETTSRLWTLPPATTLRPIRSDWQRWPCHLLAATQHRRHAPSRTPQARRSRLGMSAVLLPFTMADALRGRLFGASSSSHQLFFLQPHLGLDSLFCWLSILCSRKRRMPSRLRRRWSEKVLGGRRYYRPTAEWVCRPPTSHMRSYRNSPAPARSAYPCRRCR